MFLDRADAGIQLATKMNLLRGEDMLILAIPRGGVPVAFELSKALKAPMELVMVKKLGHPLNPEYAIGAVSPDDEVLVPHADVSEEYIQEEKLRIRKRLEEMKNKFSITSHKTNPENKTVIIVDDGVATGNTLLAAIPLIKKSKPSKIIIAVPVIAGSAKRKLEAAGADIIAVLEVESMGGIGQFYRDFQQTSDEEVMALMKSLPAWSQ